MADRDVPAGPFGRDGRADAGSRPSWWVWVVAGGLVLVAGAIVWAARDVDNSEDSASTTAGTPTTTTTTAPTTTTPLALTVEALSQQIATLVPANLRTPAWECQASTTGPLTAGSIATCVPSPLPTDGEVDTVTVVVLDDAGAYAAARSGLAHLLLNPGQRDRPLPFDPPVPPGLNCTNLLASDSAFTQEAQREQLTPEQTYFGVVLYYFTHGRSPLMDIDNNGVPCETVIERSVVDTVWGGGWIASEYD